MLVVVLFNNKDKEIEYIGRVIKYEWLSINEGFEVFEWEDLLGQPREVHVKRYANHPPVLSVPHHSTQEDRIWIKDIFEHLIVGEEWEWK